MATTGTSAAISAPTYYQQRARAIRGIIERRGWIDPAQQPTSRHPVPIKTFMADWQEQVEAWAYESLYTALSVDEPVIAFRAYVQAVEYMTRMRHEYRLPVGNLGDHLSVARHRVEDFVRGAG